jgi:hypothetical protein
MKKIIFSLLFIIGLLGFAQIEAHACSCIRPFENPTLKQEVTWFQKNAKAIFTGKVTEVTQIPQSRIGVKIKIRVERYWKSPVPVEIIITNEGTSCDYFFEVGKSYLIYASYANGSKINTNLCSGNKELQNAAGDIKLLGKSKKPQKHAPEK